MSELAGPLEGQERRVDAALVVLVHLDGCRAAGIGHLRALLPMVVGQFVATGDVPPGLSGRLHVATDGLWMLEVQAALVVAEIGSRLSERVPVPAEWAATQLRLLTRQGRARTGCLRDAGAVCPLLRPWLTSDVGGDLMGTVKRLKRVEVVATDVRAELRVLLADSDGLALA